MKRNMDPRAKVGPRPGNDEKEEFRIHFNLSRQIRQTDTYLYTESINPFAILNTINSALEWDRDVDVVPSEAWHS